MLLKNIFLLINVFILLVFQAFFEGGLTVTQNIPNKVNPGSEFIAEITVSKGDIGGFAKYSQELPDGFTASVVDANGGNFTFSDKNVKIIWMSLPSDKEFKIKYKVNVAGNVNGSFALAAKLSYLENNEKKTFDVPPSNVVVGEASANNTPVAEKPTEQASEPTTNAAAETKPEVARTVAATGSLTASRTAPASATGEFSVEVIVKKGSITGFAKLEEIIPSGFVASAASSETNGSAFSFVDGKAKFVWMSIPSSEEFKISYKIKTPDNYIGDCKLEGTFSYIENEETKKAAIAPTITVIGSGGGQAPVAQAEAPKPEVQQQTIAPKPESKPKAETVQAQAPQPKPAKVTKVTSAASGGLVYRVQVCAVHKNVPNSYFNDLFKIQEEVYSETHEGWYKYTTGAYQQYQQARDRRVNLADNGVNTGPFVTAYNNGSRVTVQEALMISRQKWVQ